MTNLDIFRVYEPHELGPDGYPHVWHRGTAETGTEGMLGVKHTVRMLNAHRCERCLHPYTAGAGEWDKDGGVPRPERGPVSLFDGLVMGDMPEAPVMDTLTGARGSTLWSTCDEHCEHSIDECRWSTWDGWTYAPLNVPEGAVCQAAWRILTVHHLNGHKHDLRWWNLAALCQRCHLHIQRKVAMERVYPFEHTEWFKPHAAGWYAYAYLCENLTREQTEMRLDELLALEQMVSG